MRPLPFEPLHGLNNYLVKIRLINKLARDAIKEAEKVIKILEKAQSPETK